MLAGAKVPPSAQQCMWIELLPALRRLRILELRSHR